MIQQGNTIVMTVEELNEERRQVVLQTIEEFKLNLKGRKMDKIQARAHLNNMCKSTFSTLLNRVTNPIPSHSIGATMFFWEKELDEWAESLKFK